ncbi:hypothetical protein AC578_6582 [Pseudocercospora eumusae]|uniref:Elongation of fatty acids protein n=1 Tax=Pseudocercospora eumusae TaxID=321146 RepID=A0A139GVZ8_9PEZI|nr:hypothetical protein AC578_6582 [Pseudocercospora eumusae]
MTSESIAIAIAIAMSAPRVYLQWPDFTFLNSFPPHSLPRAVPPPVKERSFRAPFGIDNDLFNFALKWEVPITFASLYLVAVFSLNAYNRSRNNQKWWIAKQWWFRYFVIIHNALLALYSAATFLAMCRAIAHTWPGLNSHTGLAGVADALCKIHGPRGLGDATAFNTTINIWEAKNQLIKLGVDGNPDPTDVGRLWNEGLAFWGWMFYVSKFYEVVDTAIIIAKGKRSKTLQTYHHSGAMLCMWAGIRYMSPPIWMFVFVNSFIHALMYTYYTLSALGYRSPTVLKRTLTSMQIAQFLWGASYAAAHLFIKYDIPVRTPYRVAATVSSVLSSATSKAVAASSTVSSVIATPSAFDWVAFGKKLLLRGLGEEGLAERVGVSHTPVQDFAGQAYVPKMEEKIQQFKERVEPLYETRWRQDWTKTSCIDTSGEAFAIYLNLLYLAPLTFLFARFFLQAYTNWGKPRTVKKTVESGKEAEKKTEERVEEIGERLEKKLESVDSKNIHDQLRRDVQAMKDGTFGGGRRVSQQVTDIERKVESVVERAQQQTKRLAKQAESFSSTVSSNAKHTAKKLDSGASSPRKQSPSKKNGSRYASDDDLSTPGAQKDFTPKLEPKPSREALAEPSKSSESEKKQEDNLAVTQPTRPGADFGNDQESVAASESTEQGLRPSARNGLPAGDNGSAEDTEQHQTYASVASIDDTDAMGKSGAIIDFAAEKAEQAQDEAQRLQEEVREEKPNIVTPDVPSETDENPLEGTIRIGDD